MSVRLSVCMHRCGSHWTNFRSISYCEHVRKSVKIPNIWLRVDNHIWHSKWRPKDVCTVDSSSKYSVARQGKMFCLFHGNTERFYVVDNYMYVSNKSRNHCSLSMAKGLKGRRHIVTLISLLSTTYKFEKRAIDLSVHSLIYKCIYNTVFLRWRYYFV
jgi:hypothetical protein